MKCVACDDILSDFEASIRSSNTGEYFDMCSPCLSHIRSVLETSENFLLYDPELDDLDTDFIGELAAAEMAISGLLEDDSADAVSTDGERIADGGIRREDNL